ncbi:complement factor H-related protein 1 isoform X4 [Ochotona princeps]|uniref:complement factor H-related protein 1 isoform X4 n=1 Tax=Ochotona princeps TaxID=9978 RepID=UPI0027155DB1|nr:complement factor H-related protein 1 isoform X4 [Ochotona princeps]
MFSLINVILILGVPAVIGQVKPCDFPQINHGHLYHEDRYKPYFPVSIGQRYSYYCDNNFVTPSNSYWTSITCTEDGWSPLPKCILAKNAIIISPKMARYLSGHKVRYECNRPFEIFGEVEVMCQNGTWTEAPQCKDSTGNCGPPPPIENGDITSFSSQVYPSGSSVEYQCQTMYKLEGEKKITCINGNWGKPPKCLRACVITEEIMEKHNITLKSGEKRKVYAETGDIVEFKCIQGYLPTTSQSFQVTCSDGQLEYPWCEKNSKMLL